MTHITCRLTAEDRDRLRNPTLGYRVWATFTFFLGELAVLPHILQLDLSGLLLRERRERKGLKGRGREVEVEGERVDIAWPDLI